MKKVTTILVSLLLVAALCIIFVGCGSDDRTPAQRLSDAIEKTANRGNNGASDAFNEALQQGVYTFELSLAPDFGTLASLFAAVDEIPALPFESVEFKTAADGERSSFLIVFTDGAKQSQAEILTDRNAVTLTTSAWNKIYGMDAAMFNELFGSLINRLPTDPGDFSTLQGGVTLNADTVDALWKVIENELSFVLTEEKEGIKITVVINEQTVKTILQKLNEAAATDEKIAALFPDGPLSADELAAALEDIEAATVTFEAVIDENEFVRSALVTVEVEEERLSLSLTLPEEGGFSLDIEDPDGGVHRLEEKVTVKGDKKTAEFSLRSTALMEGAATLTPLTVVYDKNGDYTATITIPGAASIELSGHYTIDGKTLDFSADTLSVASFAGITPGEKVSASLNLSIKVTAGTAKISAMPAYVNLSTLSESEQQQLLADLMQDDIFAAIFSFLSELSGGETSTPGID